MASIAKNRLIGLVSNDIFFERDPKSMWYGEPRPIGGIPVGIYQRVDTAGSGGNANAPYDANNWRLFTTVYTSPEGTYEALLPSTETFNCPIPFFYQPGTTGTSPTATPVYTPPPSTGGTAASPGSSPGGIY